MTATWEYKYNGKNKVRRFINMISIWSARCLSISFLDFLSHRKEMIPINRLTVREREMQLSPLHPPSFPFSPPSCYQHRVMEWLWEHGEKGEGVVMDEWWKGRREERAYRLEKELNQSQLTRGIRWKEMSGHGRGSNGMSGVGGSREPNTTGKEVREIFRTHSFEYTE